jgi:aerobic carbon-monoxide dehydrogenase small subunit
MHIELKINGESRELAAPSEATLLDVLRNQLELTGSKRGCNHGVCGACTVLLDGKPARACLTLAADVGERQVTTIEGVGELSSVQKALIDSGAIQCGFCTPGFVMALTSLFEKNPTPDREAVRAALSGNLCRCSGYVKIIEAAASLAQGLANDR